VADSVDVAGRLAYGDLPDAYRRADAFVLASGARTTWREQFGFAIVEAMASGLPVVAGDSGSLKEVVADRDSLATPHDPPVLAAHLARLAADPAERARQGERNRAWAEQRYDRRKVTSQLADLYERVLAEPPR
jgi:glycosyltransferase involved in cell wall biosynthesis